jgi:hypothetical protein
MTESHKEPRRISFFFIIVVAVLLTLSFASIYQAFENYRQTGIPDFLTLILSGSGISLTAYIIFQARKKPLKLGFELPEVFSEIKCSECQYKNTRKFQKGDYILKQLEKCQKCDGLLSIVSIYRKKDEKEE